MADTRKIIKIFLASPGDLQDERRGAKSVVDEINDSWADFLGYHIDLVGWEDTVSSYGRPQAIINADLEQCEFFIGMMWKRWGMPPDASGPYTSGFEEEFETAVTNKEQRGSPEISLFIKNVDEDLLRDPGDDLKKVLNFKNKIITQKAMLFETFGNIEEFQKKIRRCIERYVQKKQLEETREQAEKNQARPSEESVPQSLSQTGSLLETALSVEGARFLQSFISKCPAQKELSDFSML